MTSDRLGPVVPDLTAQETNRLERTSSLVDLAIRDGVPYPPRPAINNVPPYLNMLTRTFSVPNVNQYTGAIGPYRPANPVYTYYSYKCYFPYRNYRGYTLTDAYWYDRYYYFSPIYKRSMFPIRFRHSYVFKSKKIKKIFSSDYKANPNYWHYPHTYWSYPYQGKWFVRL
uniref:Uncharacterized protein n=1 Tax=Meloidogyne enterolobii TaxID=390850 RepID=A0A6V7USD6_MELEN|nr:unnamed protein product [Meloidogyne enterolobii]